MLRVIPLSAQFGFTRHRDNRCVMQLSRACFLLSEFTTYHGLTLVSESESEWLYYIIDTLRKGQANLLMRSCTEAM